MAQRGSALRFSVAFAALAAVTSFLTPRSEAQEQPRQGGAVIVGAVTDTLGAPLPYCAVRREDAPSAVLCDSVGRFRLAGVSHGATTFEVRRIGYVPGQFTITVPGDSIRVTIQLVQLSTPLSPITVEASGLSPWLVVHGFYDRMRSGFRAAYITPEEYASLRVQHVSQAFSGRPGVRITYSEGNVAIPWDVTERCVLNVFVDGLEIRGLFKMPPKRGGVSFEGAFDRLGNDVQSTLQDASVGKSIGLDDFIPPNMVEAIEIYGSGPQTPIEFRTTNECGAIVIWSKIRTHAAPADSGPDE